MRERLRRAFGDSLLSVVGMVAMNMAAQFAVYPAWARALGTERYGDVLYLLSLMNIYAISAGSSLNYARMRTSASRETHNAPYLLLLLALTLPAAPAALAAARFSGASLTGAETALYALLIAATLWRFYADVEFRLTLDYRRACRFYLLIGAGYLLGIPLFRAGGAWPAALLCGEALGVGYVLLRGRALRPDPPLERAELSGAARLFAVLTASEVLGSVIFNGDRLLLRTALGGEAVTVYYLASLLGKTISLITTPLNSVIMGYLARVKGALSPRAAWGLAAGALLAVPLLALGCTLGSMLLIPLLYPAQAAQAGGYFFIANAAQVAYFVTGVVTVVLLRFSRAREQVWVNALYGVGFALVCVPATAVFGFNGFCAGLLAVNLLRLLLALGLCLRAALSGREGGERI